MGSTCHMLLQAIQDRSLMDTEANTIGLDVTSFRTSRLSASVKNDCVCTFRMGKADHMSLSAP